MSGSDLAAAQFLAPRLEGRPAMALLCVPPATVTAVLPAVADMLRSATARTRLGSFADIERSLVDGRALLWLAWDGSQIAAVAATELQPCDGGLVCTITACGGRNASEWLPLLDGIEAYAKGEGCRAVRFFGRTGWLRKLPRYQQVGIVAEMPVDGR